MVEGQKDGGGVDGRLGGEGGSPLGDDGPLELLLPAEEGLPTQLTVPGALRDREGKELDVVSVLVRGQDDRLGLPPG